MHSTAVAQARAWEPREGRRAFRLNLEQQRKRAKDVLRAFRARDRAALHRLSAIAAPRLDKPAG